MGDGVIRDFIYLDVERLRSFVAQAAGGLVDQITSKEENRTSGKADLEGGLPLGLAKLKGGTDHYYLRSSGETKSLHDAIFDEFNRLVLTDERVSDLSLVTADDWGEHHFVDGRFLKAIAPLKIIDYDAVARRIETLPKLNKSISKVAANQDSMISHKSRSKSPKNQPPDVPLKDVVSVIRDLYGGIIRIKAFPIPDDPRFVLVGTADRSMFRYSPEFLANTYGQVVDADWTCILQVNRGESYAPNELTSSTGNQSEDGLELVIDNLVALNVIAQGIEFPAVAVTPVAIFRTV